MVKLRIGLVLGAALILLLAVPVARAGEPDLSGEWTLTMEGDSPSGEGSVMVTFAQDGNRLVATMHGEHGTVDCQGWADGDAVRFYYMRPSEGGEFVAKYTGHVSGDLMGGEVDMGEQGKTKWRATRGADKGIDLDGTWTMTMEGDSPSGMKSVGMKFHQDGPHLMVTMMGDQHNVECEGYLQGNALRFYYVRPTSEGQFVAIYKGHVGGDVMGGEVDLGDMGKTTWKATRN